AYVIQKVQLKRNLARLGSVERAIETQEDALITQQETKSRILARFDEATVMRLKDLENIRTMSSARGTGLTAAFFEKKGKLPTPVIGRLRQRFGILKDKASEAKLRYKGHYYEAPIGETVKAVHSGEIAFSGDVVGYGATVVISHGDHYYSVYGGLRKIDVEEGDRVSVDDPVGTSGDSYYLFSSGLYFEIRHFSDPVNPAEWLADSGRQITFVQEDQ
ncbi:MAG: peptidoglycan DD-metalloendopeptidase family protein, partial [Bdellovibrionia bacterium]